MKFSCTQENLYQGLQVVGHLATKNTNLPILSNVLLKIENKNLKLVSTNLELGISCLVRAKTEEEGEFTVEARLFSDFLSLLPKEKVDLVVKDHFLQVVCKNYKTKIKGLAAAEFPLIPQVAKNNPFTCSVGEFKQAVSEVIFAVSTAETRPEISGVYLNFNTSEKEITLAATDSYRLAERKISLSKTGSKNQEETVIVPVKTLQELVRILTILKDELVVEENRELEIYVTENQILFSYNNTDLVSRIIEGQYPDYRQIIPQNYKTQINTENSELVKTIKAASLFTKSGIYDVKLEFKKTEKEIIISSSNTQTGENTANLSAEVVGEDNEVVINYRYVLDGLQNIGTEQATIELNESTSPVVIKPKEGKKYLYIVMPIKQ